MLRNTRFRRAVVAGCLAVSAVRCNAAAVPSAAPAGRGIEARVVAIRRGPFPNVTLTLVLLTPLPGSTGQTITAEPLYVGGSGKRRDLSIPANVMSLAAYYLMPGDRITAVALPRGRTPTATWYVRQVQRIAMSSAPRPATLQTELTTNKASYALGEPVAITLSVTNRGDLPAQLEFANAQKFELTVTRKGREVWRWSAGRMLAQVLATITLGPGDTLTFQEEWNQLDNDGDRVPPGDYTVAGWLTAKGRREMTRTTADIRILPPNIDEPEARLPNAEGEREADK